MPLRSWFPEELTGDTVVLRRHVPANLAAFRRWYGDPAVARLTRYQDGPMRPDEIERFFAARVVGSDSLALAVHVRESGRLIGSCAFSQLDGDNGTALYHITIGEKDCWGRGYGTDATRLMLAHAFENLGLHRVGLTVFAFNERAIRSYRKVGFTVEGRSRESILRDGRYWDEVSMSILEPEWRAIQAASGGAPVAAAGAGRTACDDAGSGRDAAQADGLAHSTGTGSPVGRG
jgi:RimJ/RimL family protein N-acetyltransferase